MLQYNQLGLRPGQSVPGSAVILRTQIRSSVLSGIFGLNQLAAVLPPDYRGLCTPDKSTARIEGSTVLVDPRSCSDPAATSYLLTTCTEHWVQKRV